MSPLNVSENLVYHLHWQFVDNYPCLNLMYDFDDLAAHSNDGFQQDPM